MSHSRHAVAKPCLLWIVSCLLAFGSLIALPSAASADTAYLFGIVDDSDPTYVPNADPCGAGSTAAHYEVIQAKLVGTGASTLTVTVNPDGFRGKVGVYQGIFMPQSPRVNCFRTVTAASSGAGINYSTSLSALLPGFADQTFYIVVSGATTADLGNFTATITSTNGTVVIVPPAPIADTTPPSLSLPQSITAEATSSAGRAVTFTATANDAVSGSLPVSCSLASGSTFPIGATKVDCSATDGAANQARGSFWVTIQDKTGPVLLLPADVTVAATGSSGRAVTYSATASDAVSGSRTVTCSPASGSIFPHGATTVDCTSSDAAGNRTDGSFTVTVRDETGPVLTLPSNITAEATGASGRVVTYSATANDAVSGSRTVTCSPASGSTFPIATTTVDCSSTDAAGNETIGSFTVKIQDTTGPALTLPSNITAEATGASGRVVNYSATANDAVSGSRAVTCSPASGSTFPIATTTVDCSSTDAAGNETIGSFTVKIQDTTGPVITVPNDFTAEATGASGRVVTYTATANDAVSGSRAVTCSPASGSTFPIATTTVDCSSTDAAGNESSKSFEVAIVDTSAPVLSLPSTITGSATGESGAFVMYTVTANDLVDGSVTPSCFPASGTVFPIGSTTVNCSVKDARDNTRTGSFTVSVSEGTMSRSGAVTVTGTPKVGETLEADSTVTTSPASAATAGQWLRNGTPIASATASTYTLTGDDLDANISYRQIDSLPGYTSVTTTSAAVGPVALGSISVPVPSITGEARVGETLTTSLGTVSPSGVDVAFEWFAGAESVGTGTSYTVKPDDVGTAITVEATGTKSFHAPASEQSAATAAVVPGEFDQAGVVSVSGTPKVGQTLTASSTVTTSPSATSVTGQWLRGETPIDGATDLTYELTNDDVSAEISYRETRMRAGYETVTARSVPTSTITGGIITLAEPTIAGSAVVDQVLTATPGAVAPSGASVALTWNVEGVGNGATGTTYTVKPGDVGKVISVTAEATQTDYDTVRKTSAETAEVASAVFSAGVTATISGVFKVGEELTAHEGAVTPVPDSFAYQWFADDEPIDRATSRTLTLARAHKDASISVKVTAIRDGYVAVADTSEASAKVVTNVAPDVTLTPSAAKLRLGDSTTLAWTSGDALSVEASGAWSGAKALSGSESVAPSTAGTHAYTLTATNGSGTTTAQVSVEVALPAVALKLKARKTVKTGRKITISASGLAPREAYTIRIGGKLLASGKATASGKVKRAVRVPASTKSGKRLVRVTGSLTDRTGTRRVKVAKPRAPSITLRDSKVRASDDQRVTVRNLRPDQKVTVTYKGERISPKSARANGKGVYALTFDAGMHWGRKTVTVTASGRSRSATFTVVNRCPQGGLYCR